VDLHVLGKAASVISGVPTICSCLRLLLTVERLLTLITIDAMPNATRTAPAASPPSCSVLRIMFLSSMAGERCGVPARGLGRDFISGMELKPFLP
jgi:hypothetical protein